MAVHEIPLSPGPQSLTADLGGTDYRLRLTYNAAEEGSWILDIGDADGVPMVCGIPLIPGQDLLGQYHHLGFTGSLFVDTFNRPNAYPTYDGLGSESRLYFATRDDVTSLAGASS